jgi:hypothetical protein
MTIQFFVPDLGNTLAGVFRLQPGAFARAETMSSDAIVVALAVVLLAGFSEAISQSIVLFANRVKAARFIFSYAIDAFLFLFGYAFLVVSTWLVCRIPGTPHLPFGELALVLALSYAPLLFSFLGALPYLGPYVLMVLRVWHLLAMIVGVSVVGHVGYITAGTYVGLGWIVMVLAAQSFAKPIATLGTKILDAVAGVTLVDDEQLVLGRAISGTQDAGTPSAPIAVTTNVSTHPKTWQVVLGLVAVAALGLLLALTLDPIRGAMFGWENELPRVVRVPLDLFWLGFLALMLSAFMAPLETLGWWAGWYGDTIDTTVITDASDDKPDTSGVSRYVIYLDGIAQSSSQYTPDIETFLDALAPVLPGGTRLIRGVMSYSVMNRPLEDDPLFSAFWKFIDSMRFKNIDPILGMIVNLRNVLIVAVSADPRYGPIYNFGIAQVLYRSLIANGYRLRSGVPVTLIGYSGGGQMSCASARFLKHAIDAPVDVISLGGVISGNDPILDLEHLFHLVGDKDKIERIGPVMFPSRWKIALLSNWNRAKRLGRVTEISLGPVGHQVPGGMLDPNLKLSDGRSSLQQTLDYITNILLGRISVVDPGLKKKPSNYERYVAVPWNRPDYYPLEARPPSRYLPVAPWIGRLILPDAAARFGGVWFEVHRADDAHASLIGKRVKLLWNLDAPGVRDVVRAVTRDVSFSAEADYTSIYGGLVHPVRINRWRMVDPLESLAASHPIDDVIVKLAGDVSVDGNAEDTVLRIGRQPVQITGRYYGLVRFFGAEADDRFRVVHYDPDTGKFDGPEELVRLPAVVEDLDGRAPSVAIAIESSPLNHYGWYVYGAPDAAGAFVVQSLAPRALLRVAGGANIDAGSGYKYVRRQAWRDVVAARNSIVRASDGEWKIGDVALLVHTYGGIGGAKREGAASGPIYFGHFAYGIARVADEPLSGEPVFDITYYQVYTNNTDGLIAGALDWSRYMGDRQFGWAGVRPVCDVMLDHEAFAPALPALALQLEAMTARYRIGDGTGGTYVGAANNCSQDSNRALFATLRSLKHDRRLGRLARDLKWKLQPFGAPRRDWSHNEYNLGSTMEDAPIQNIVTALGSWRCILPRLACNTIAGTFIGDGADLSVLGTDAVGGPRTDVEPVVPFAF